MVTQLKLGLRIVRAIVAMQQFNNPGSAYHRQAQQMLNRLMPESGREELPASAQKKFRWYMAECRYTGERLVRLCGLKAEPERAELYLAAGALISMCDLIIDDVELSLAEIQALESPREPGHYTDYIPQLYARCYHYFVGLLPAAQRSAALGYYRQLFGAQLRSQRQLSGQLSPPEVDSICRDKCGYTLLLLRALVPAPLPDAEREALFAVGAYVQYCNDAQDLHKDLQAGLSTVASVRPDLLAIARAIDQQKGEAYRLLKASGRPDRQLDEFVLTLEIMGIAILAKLHAYKGVCGGQFSREAFRARPKEEVRAALSYPRLLGYWWPRIRRYRYATAEQPYPFDLDLENC